MLAQPDAGVLGEALGRLLALALQRQVDVVVVDEHRAEARPASIRFIATRPPDMRRDYARLVSRHGCTGHSRSMRNRVAQSRQADACEKPMSVRKTSGN